MQTREAQSMGRTPVARRRGRLGTSAWTVGVAVGVVVALLLGAPTVGTAGGGHHGDDDGPCEGTRGACRLLCKVAVVADCFDDEDGRVCALLQKALDKRHCGIDLSPEPPPVACPCAGETAGGVEWSNAFQTAVCLLPPTTLWYSATQLGGLEVVTSADGSASACLLATGTVPALQLPIAGAQIEACNASLRQIAAAEDPPALGGRFFVKPERDRFFSRLSCR